MSQRTRADWAASAEKVRIETRALIGGRFVKASGGATFETINPATGNLLAEVEACDETDVDRAVAGARAAFRDGRWSSLHPVRRGEVLIRLAALIEDHADELALLETLDVGKPITFSRTGDVVGAAAALRWYGEAADKIAIGEIAPSDANGLALITHEPVGVVGAVVPWNFPLPMAAWKLGPALAAGNSVVLKPAEQSSLTALRLGELALEAGLPEGVLNIVPGLGEVAGRALGLHMDVDAIAFTGSTQVGKHFMEYSGRSNLKRVSLECGGKSAQIVMDDCPDLDAAAAAAAQAIFFNQGEVCSAASRLLVHRAVKDEFLDKVLAAANEWQPGDPLDPKTTAGALVDKAQYERVLAYIDASAREGACLKLGGRPVMRETGGYFVEPTVYDGVDPSMTIAREEIFGPVLAVMTFADEGEAAHIANGTIYGLAAGVWTRDISRAHCMARALEAGTVWVNCWDGSYDMSLPFGGYKQSGFGRDRSLHAIEKYTNTKTTWVKL